MKILGYNDTNGQCIVSINKDEIANLVGMYSHYDSEFKDIFKLNGAEIEVSKLYKDHRTLMELKTKLLDMRGGVTDKMLELTSFVNSLKDLNQSEDLKYSIKIRKVVEYCYNKLEIMWAASVVGILLDCDFKDSKERAKEYLENEKLNFNKKNCTVYTTEYPIPRGDIFERIYNERSKFVITFGKEPLAVILSSQDYLCLIESVKNNSYYSSCSLAYPENVMGLQVRVKVSGPIDFEVKPNDVFMYAKGIIK